ncbi:hypothetical protein B0T22DRAFT_534885 [Podospora appendiculata]|uniref:NECAP PHear domain-containing protein n=1 Tax=Podospora appendiculata TaxID=314037 RepID=A0AAE0X7F7_9PEZI|nr:hypothetical protein B0T22DRAFT_534885 [Podospora appendiculata]
METTIDPATGHPLPADAIQRILHIAKAVHVYNIPPQTSAKGHMAATWTEDPKRHIFTCRARIIETATSTPSSSTGDSDGAEAETESESVKVDIVLEDASAGQLFAAAPYTTPAVVEPAADSSRFFALRVQDDAGRKATLGIGFEERSDAFDFSIALQEAQKALGLIDGGGAPAGSKGVPHSKPKEEVKRDYSLKDGETITVNLSGTKFGRRGARPAQQPQQQQSGGEMASLSSFALPPPPPPSSSSSSSFSSSSATNAFLPPPPSAKEVKSRRRISAQALGFDDGQFGEFA